MKKAIVLCSGGLDSVVTSFYVKKKLDYDSLTLLFFNYGQRSLKAERRCSKMCSRSLKAEFMEIKIRELKRFSSSLINESKKHNKLSRKDLKNTRKESGNWYVPCRNLIFLSYASAVAEYFFVKSKIKMDIFIGFKNDGKETFPDTTLEFVKKFNSLNAIISVGKFRLHAPLIKKDKEDIVLLGKKLDVNMKKTFSCYTSEKKHCGTCLACRLRQEGFYWAGLTDPTGYLDD